MFAFKHQRRANSVFINIIARAATRFCNAHALNDANIEIPNSQFEILDFQKPKGVFAADIEALLARKRKMQTRIIQRKINDMQTRLNAPPSSATAAASKAPETATGDSAVKINEDFRIPPLVTKYSSIS